MTSAIYKKVQELFAFLQAMYVCVYIRMYVYVCACMHVYVCMYVITCMYVCML